MSMHTQGPWRYSPPQKGTIFGHEVFAGGELVAQMNHHPAKALEAEADARLIAAAPDMLAALEGMVEMATHHMMEPKERREILRNARAAIAKAKGEQ